MIIKCPQCKNKFLAPDDLEEGQKLQCANCDFIWALSNDINEIPTNIRPITHLPAEHGPDNAKHFQNFEKVKKAMTKEETKFQAYLKETMHSLEHSKNFLFTCLLVVIIITPVFGFRQQIAKAWEPSITFYEMVGLSIPVPGEGLVFQDVNAKEVKNKVVVSGKIYNSTDRVVSIPPLKVNGQIVARNFEQHLDPNTSFTFTTDLAKTNNISVRVSF